MKRRTLQEGKKKPGFREIKGSPASWFHMGPEAPDFSKSEPAPKKPLKNLKCPIHGKDCNTPAFCNLDLKLKLEGK